MLRIDEPVFYCGDELQNWKLERMDKIMDENGLDAIVFTKHDSVRYISGFYTKGYRPFLEFDYLGVVVRGKKVVVGYSMAGEERRIATRSRATEARKLGSLNTWDVTIAEILSDYGVTSGRVGFDLLPHFVYANLVKRVPSVEFVDISGLWADLTAIKHPLEVQLIKEALEITMAGMRAGIAAAKPGVTELEISAAAECEMRRMGSEVNPFIPVVCSGENSAIWERVATERVVGNNEMMILDFGCVYKGYTGDFARTIIVGDPTPLHKKIYTTAYVAQKEAVKAMKPGVKCKDIDAIVRRVAKDFGMERYIQPWASGHQLGFGLHGTPLVGPNVEDELKESMVINIEPGLTTYDNLSGGGVEIEDTVIITANGAEYLTNFPYEEKLIDHSML